MNRTVRAPTQRFVCPPERYAGQHLRIRRTHRSRPMAPRNPFQATRPPGHRFAGSPRHPEVACSSLSRPSQHYLLPRSRSGSWTPEPLQPWSWVRSCSVRWWPGRASHRPGTALPASRQAVWPARLPRWGGGANDRLVSPAPAEMVLKRRSTRRPNWFSVKWVMCISRSAPIRAKRHVSQTKVSETPAAWRRNDRILRSKPVSEINVSIRHSPRVVRR